MAKVYVDSNVFISVIQNDFGGKFEFMSNKSEEFFDRVTGCLHTIIISKEVLKEITDKTYLTEDEIKKHFVSFWDKVTFVEPILDDLLKAEEINNRYHTGRMDALFLVIARKEKCDCIVTWNRKDFEKVSTDIKIFDPRDI